MRCEVEVWLLVYIRYLLRKNVWVNGGVMRGVMFVKFRIVLGIREIELVNL